MCFLVFFSFAGLPLWAQNMFPGFLDGFHAGSQETQLISDRAALAAKESNTGPYVDLVWG